MRKFTAGIKKNTGLALLALAAAILLLVNPGFRSLVSNKIELFKMGKKMSALKTETEGLKKLAAETARTESVEYNARKELGMLKPGEIEYRFPPPPETEREK